MNEHPDSPVAVVGLAAIMPDAPDATTFWQNLRDGRYSISDVPPERWDPELYYDPTRRAGQDLQPHRRLGARPPVGAAGLAAPDAAEGRRAARRGPAVGGLGCTVGPARRRLADVAGRPRARRGDPRQRDRRREALPDVAAGPVPGVSPRPARVARPSPRCPQTTRAAILDGVARAVPGPRARDHRGHHARRARRTSWPAGSPTSSTSGDPNFTTDAACASGLAATATAVHGLANGDFDAVVTGGIDRNMGVDGFVKFCKIGALSATGTRPFDAGADGFVMGEGAALFVLKRLEDAERDGDRVYAVLLGLGGSSDGKGKGITAPNPVGQRLAVERAWATPASTRRPPPRSRRTAPPPGSATPVELASLGETSSARSGPGPVRSRSARSSPTSVTSRPRPAQPGCSRWSMQLHEKQLLPSLNFRDPNPSIDWDSARRSAVNTELRDWPADPDGARRGRRQRVRLRRHELPRRPRGARPRPAPFATLCAVLRLGRDPERRLERPGRRPPPPASGRSRCAVPWCSEGRDDADVVAQLEAARLRGHGWPGSRPAPPPTRRWAPRPCASPSTTPTGRTSRRRSPGRSRRSARDRRRVEDPASAGCLRRPWSGAEGRLPLHRPGIAVRQHAADPAGPGSGGRRDLRGGGPDHDAVARTSRSRRTSLSTRTTRPPSRRRSGS